MTLTINGIRYSQNQTPDHVAKMQPAQRAHWRNVWRVAETLKKEQAVRGMTGEQLVAWYAEQGLVG